MKLVISDYAWTVHDKISHANEQNLGILYSYFYARKDKRNMPALAAVKDGIWLDSGVYTARKKNLKITTKELVDFYHKNEQTVKYVFSNDEGTMAEQIASFDKMISEGVPQIAIWHGEGLHEARGVMKYEAIDKFAEKTNYIAVGLNRVDKTVNDKYLDNFFNYLYKRGKWPMKVHLLGCEMPSVLLKYPFYSCDTSTYAHASVFGDYSYLDKKVFRIKRINLRDNFSKALNISIDAHTRNDRFYENDAMTRNNRIKDSIIARGELQKIITDVWTKRGITWDEE